MGVSPQIILILIGFSIIFPIHFGGKPPIFGSTPINSTMDSFPWDFSRKQPTVPTAFHEESRVNKVSEEVRIGQEVSVRVLSAEGKLSLSMKPMSFLEKKDTKSR